MRVDEACFQPGKGTRVGFTTEGHANEDTKKTMATAPSLLLMGIIALLENCHGNKYSQRDSLWAVRLTDWNMFKCTSVLVVTGG